MKTIHSRQLYALCITVSYLFAGFIFWWTGVAPVIGFALVMLAAVTGLGGFGGSTDT